MQRPFSLMCLEIILSIKSKEQQRKCIKIFHSAYKDFLLDFWVVHRVVKELDFEPDPRMIHMTRKAKECFTYAARQT